MTKVSLRINEAYERKAAKERFEQMRQEQEVKEQQRQAKLAVLAEKKASSGLTLEDVDAKLDIVLEMLEELVRR